MLDHVVIGWDRRWPRRLRLRRVEPEAVDEREDEDVDEGGSSIAALFFWGVLTALTLWWLYLRPTTPERRLGTQAAAPQRRPRPAAEASGRAQPPAEEATLVVEVEGDDLTVIHGIGPARATRLQEAGIATFAALAVADAEQLRDILAGVGVGVGNADVSSWPEQASLAAKGDWEALEAYQEQLRADRE